MSGISIVYHYNEYSKIEHIESILNKVKVLKQSNDTLEFKVHIVGIKNNLNQIIVKKLHNLSESFKEFNSGFNIKVCDNSCENRLYSLYKQVYESDFLLEKVLFLNGNVKNLINILSFLYVTPSDIIDYKLVDSVTKLVKYDGYSIFSHKNGVKTIGIDNIDTIHNDSDDVLHATVFSTSFNQNVFGARKEILHHIFSEENNSKYFFDVRASIYCLRNRISMYRITNKGFEVDIIEQHNNYMYDKNSTYAEEFNSLNKLIEENKNCIPIEEIKENV